VTDGIAPFAVVPLGRQQAPLSCRMRAFARRRNFVRTRCTAGLAKTASLGGTVLCCCPSTATLELEVRSVSRLPMTRSARGWVSLLRDGAHRRGEALYD
jgi:hypothetical protein